MKEIISDTRMVAYCGLYCGACKRYLKGSCPGCHDYIKATWCKVRTCCIDEGYSSCVECKKYDNPDDCAYFNNFISKIFGFIFQSNRAGCIDKIREIGLQSYADYMAENRMQTIKR